MRRELKEMRRKGEKEIFGWRLRGRNKYAGRRGNNE